nr:MAG TPA: hypothetical protein [Caudoviricetes sp.]
MLGNAQISKNRLSQKVLKIHQSPRNRHGFGGYLWS